MEAFGTNAGEPPPRWRLNYKIGSGSFGTVFLEKVLARGMESPELWAVKRISRTLPNFPAKRYQAEMQNLRVLSKDADYVYIAMEYMPVGDISKTFVNDNRWNERDARVVIEQLLHGLAAMHQEGITHRDLKPENIFLCLPASTTQAVHVKIGDFGTSKHIAASNASTYLRTTTGTFGYMAPEMLDTSIPKTSKVDIWSLGCILFRMVAGRLLFQDLSALYRYAINTSSLPPPVGNVGFSTPCENFLASVLQPSPDDRPSAEACLNAAWIMNEGLGPKYAVGKHLYTNLSIAMVGAPGVDTFAETVADQRAGDIGEASDYAGGEYNSFDDYYFNDDEEIDF